MVARNGGLGRGVGYRRGSMSDRTVLYHDGKEVTQLHASVRTHRTVQHRANSLYINLETNLKVSL